VIVLGELEEIVMLLERQGRQKDFWKAKINAAALEKKPLFRPFGPR